MLAFPGQAFRVGFADRLQRKDLLQQVDRQAEHPEGERRAADAGDGHRRAEAQVDHGRFPADRCGELAA
jgi:hypothetical protein